MKLEAIFKEFYKNEFRYSIILTNRINSRWKIPDIDYEEIRNEDFIFVSGGFKENDDLNELFNFIKHYSASFCILTELSSDQILEEARKCRFRPVSSLARWRGKVNGLLYLDCEHSMASVKLIGKDTEYFSLED